MTKILKISEEQVTRKLWEWIVDADSDEIARLVGDLYGGTCYTNKNEEGVFNFEPNEFFTNEIEDESELLKENLNE
jgi:hypothetical protein